MINKKTAVNLIFVAVVIYAFLGAYFTLNLPFASGDEALFISDVNFIESQGWIKAIEKGISIPHALIVYPLTWFLEPYIALRLLNVLLFIILCAYLYYRNKPTLWFFIYFIFFIGTSKVFFKGTNDALFILGLVVFLNEIYQVNLGKYWKGGLALSALLLSSFTRELIIIYLPIVFLGMFLVLRDKKIKTKQFIAPALLLILFVIINIPSLKANGKLSYDRKVPSGDIEVSWSQRQYLAQILVNKGELPNFQHPTFLETQQYVEENGINSLPKTTLESLLFDPKLTIIEFFKDFQYIIFYGSRQLSLILVIILGCFLFNFKSFMHLKHGSFIPLSLLILTSIFAFIIISYVELRWLIPVFIMAIVYFSYLEEVKKISKNISVINVVFLLILMVYGIYKIIPKL